MVKVLRDMFHVSGHLAMFMKMKLHERCMFRKQVSEEKARLVTEKLNSEEMRKEYK